MALFFFKDDKSREIICIKYVLLLCGILLSCLSCNKQSSAPTVPNVQPANAGIEMEQNGDFDGALRVYLADGSIADAIRVAPRAPNASSLFIQAFTESNDIYRLIDIIKQLQPETQYKVLMSICNHYFSDTVSDDNPIGGLAWPLAELTSSHPEFIVHDEATWNTFTWIFFILSHQTVQPAANLLINYDAAKAQSFVAETLDNAKPLILVAEKNGIAESLDFDGRLSLLAVGKIISPIATMAIVDMLIERDIKIEHQLMEKLLSFADTDFRVVNILGTATGEYDRTMTIKKYTDPILSSIAKSLVKQYSQPDEFEQTINTISRDSFNRLRENIQFYSWYGEDSPNEFQSNWIRFITKLTLEKAECGDELDNVYYTESFFILGLETDKLNRSPELGIFFARSTCKYANSKSVSTWSGLEGFHKKIDAALTNGFGESTTCATLTASETHR